MNLKNISGHKNYVIGKTQYWGTEKMHVNISGLPEQIIFKQMELEVFDIMTHIRLTRKIFLLPENIAIS